MGIETAIMAGVAAIGTGISAAGSIKAGKAQARYAREQAAAARVQAGEILRRADINAVAGAEQAADLTDQQISGFARSGVNAFEGSPLLFMEETAKRAKRDISNLRYDAEQEANALIMGAEAMGRQAGAYEAAGWMSGAGTLLTGAYGIASQAGFGGLGMSGSGKRSSQGVGPLLNRGKY